MTAAQKAWRKKWQETYNGLPKDWDPGKRFNRAHELMRKHHGPEPSGWVGAIIAALFGFMKAGGTMKWDWTKTLWKAIRGALGAAAAVGVLAFLGAFDTEAELTASGVPTWLAPIVVMGVAFVVSWVRNWIAVAKPELNMVKKAGAAVRGQ